MNHHYYTQYLGDTYLLYLRVYLVYLREIDLDNNNNNNIYILLIEYIKRFEKSL